MKDGIARRVLLILEYTGVLVIVGEHVDCSNALIVYREIMPEVTFPYYHGSVRKGVNFTGM